MKAVRITDFLRLQLRLWWRDSKDVIFLFFGGAWPIMLEGLEVLSMYLSPIYPAYRTGNVPFNWTNPWSVGCPNLNGSITSFAHDYCYGTNIAHFGGPYSIMWYWSMYALALGGRYYPWVNNLTVMVGISSLVTWRLRVRYPGANYQALITSLYTWIAFAFMVAWPQILLPLFLTATSLLVSRKWLRATFLGLAIAFRLPIGAPIYVWRFIFGFSVHVWGNAVPYAMTIVFWLVALAFFLKDTRFSGFVKEHLSDRRMMILGLALVWISFFTLFGLPYLLPSSNLWCTIDPMHCHPTPP